jgi:hypothetical protein
MESGTNIDPASNDLTKQALDILMGKSADASGDGDEEPKKPDGKKGTPKTFTEAAERLGIKPEEFYKLTVAMGGDEEESFTVGALKDAMKERTDFKLEQLRFGEHKAEQEGELMRSRNELSELLSLLPKEAIKPEVINKIREKHETALKLERERTMNVIPEWKDEGKRTADIAGMREHLSKAGFPANYLNNVSDHKTMRYIRENMLREQRIAQALALVKPKQQKGQAPSPRGSSMKSPNAPANQQGRRGGTAAEGQKISQIKDLLRGN